MNDREDIEVLDDFGFDDEEIVNHQQTNTTNITDNKIEEINFETEKEQKEQLENPVVEMINNKTTMKLIGVMLIVLFVAVFLMPKFFELIGNI